MTSSRKAAYFQRGLAVGVLSFSSLFAQPSVLGVYNDAGIPPVDYPPEAIAPGSVFKIYGLSIGSPILEKAAGYPLPTSLAGTSIQVNADGKTLDAFIISTSEKQIRAVLPSTTPLGDAQLIINHDGMLSRPHSFQVVNRAFAFYGAAQILKDDDWILNDPDHPAQTG